MARQKLEAKRFVISFRVNPKEMQVLQLLAEESGLSLSSLLRERLNLGKRRGKSLSPLCS